MQQPKLFIKKGDDDEFNIADKVQGLEYLGDNATLAATTQLQQNAGTDGAIFQYHTYNNYQIPANFALKFTNWQDFKLAKHEITRMFATREPMRIRTDTEKYLVRFVLPTVPTIAPAETEAKYSLFTVNFDNPSGYRYSIFRSDADWGDAGTQFGMNLPVQKPSYHFTSNSFKVYNASDIKIDPFKQNHDLKIICKFMGSSLKLTNKTNNTEWSYNQSSDGKQTIILDGIATTVDGKSASGSTDYGTITLEPGWNDIDVTGADSVDITFSFPFVYL